MKHLDEYRDAASAERLIASIHRRATRRWTIMEVCGGQTHSLLRHGIDEALADVVELIHGPGCPVCVTPAEAIDLAIDLSQRPGVTLTSFGDMLRVPGNRGSLMQARSAGGAVKMVYSPMDAVQMAANSPDQQVIFFAVGFETTAPATALAIQQAAARGLANFSILLAHVRVVPAMEMLGVDPQRRLQGFLAAGHACTVTGLGDYYPLVERIRLPVVVAGFEPVDLLLAIDACVEQLEAGSAQLTNCYRRSVREHGNENAQRILTEVFEPADMAWRGIGVVPNGGWRLWPGWKIWDARERFGSASLPVIVANECRAGEILSGRLRPNECPHFQTDCTPEKPLGAPMVSAEGACAAYSRYARHRLEVSP